MLALAKGGDKDVFNDLMTPDRMRILKVAARSKGLTSHHDIDEAAREALWLAWQKIDSLNGGIDRLDGWLYRIGQRQALTVLKRRASRHRRHVSLKDSHQRSDRRARTAENVTDQAAVAWALRELSQTNIDIVLLHNIGLS